MPNETAVRHCLNNNLRNRVTSCKVQDPVYRKLLHTLAFLPVDNTGHYLLNNHRIFCETQYAYVIDNRLLVTVDATKSVQVNKSSSALIHQTGLPAPANN